MNKKFFVIFIVLFLSILACGIGNNTANNNVSQPNPDAVATSVAATQAALNTAETTGDPAEVVTEAPSPEPDYLLDHALYFLAETSSDVFQVFRLARDGVSLTQVTHEPGSVLQYTVNPQDGRVAYVANNQIFLVDADGSNRSMLIDGGPIDENSDTYHYLTKIGSLAWSADGNILAYGHGGLRFYNFSTNTSTLLIPNQTFEYGGGGIGPQELFNPMEWSPDGSLLLINVSWMEGGTLSVYNPVTNNNVILGYGIVCCSYNWSNDGNTLYTASPILGLIESGLWRYDVNTGVETTLIASMAPDDTYNFAAAPKQIPNGDLLFFFGNTPDFPESDAPLTLVHTAADGFTGMFSVRPESWVFYEALWDDAGTSIVLVQPTPGPYTYPRRGPIVLIDTIGSPAIPLAASGMDLKWGP